MSGRPTSGERPDAIDLTEEGGGAQRQEGEGGGSAQRGAQGCCGAQRREGEGGGSQHGAQGLGEPGAVGAAWAQEVAWHRSSGLAGTGLGGPGMGGEGAAARAEAEREDGAGRWRGAAVVGSAAGVEVGGLGGAAGEAAERGAPRQGHTTLVLFSAQLVLHGHEWPGQGDACERDSGRAWEEDVASVCGYNGAHVCYSYENTIRLS